MNSKSLRSFVLWSLALACAATLPAQEARLANLATRGQTGTGAEVLTAGFVIGPGPDKQVVIRAIGPTLSAFGLSGLLADPFLTLINASTQATVATNDNWRAADAATMAAAGAFALPANSKDAVIIATLAPGRWPRQSRSGRSRPSPRSAACCSPTHHAVPPLRSPSPSRRSAARHSDPRSSRPFR